MKKIIWVIAVILVLALATGVYYKIKIAKLPIEKVLPEGAAIFVHAFDIEKSLEEFKTTRLWQNLKNIDVESLLQKSGVDQQELARYREAQDQALSFISGLLLGKFFGKELALAVYPAAIGKLEGEDALLNLAENIVLITRLKPPAEFADLAAKLWDRFSRKPEFTHRRYKDYEVSLIKLSDKLNLNYVKVKDLLVISPGEGLINACLDVVSGSNSSLFQNRYYNLALAQLPASSRMICFVNFELLSSNIRQLIAEIPARAQMDLEQKTKILESFDKSAGFKTIAAASVPGEVIQHKTVLFFDKSRMDPAMARAISFKPQKNSTINFIPQNILYYQWSNSLDAQLSWDNFKKELARMPQKSPQGPAAEDIISGIEESLGVSIEGEIIPALGNETGGFLSDINLEGPFPIPELLVFIKVHNKAAAANILAGLMQKSSLALAEEMYKGTQIKYISLPFGMSLQPGYCFLEDYLLIASRNKLLKASIDTSGNEVPSLAANKDFQAVDFGLTKENNAVSFVQSDLCLRKIGKILAWGVDWLSLMEARLEAFQREMQRKLDSLRIAAQAKEEELKLLQASLSLLSSESEELQSQGLDLSSREAELNSLQTRIKQKEAELKLAQKALEENEQTLRQMMQGSPVAKTNLALFKLYLTEVIYPILDALESYKALGLRSVFTQDTLVTQTFLKHQER